MKTETVIIIFKGLSFTLVGAFAPWASALGQWANSEQWPPKIIWVGVILPMSVVGGFGALQAFLTSSFHTYQQQMKADKTGEPQTDTVKPTVPKEETSK